MSKQYNVTQAKEIEGRDKPIWIKHGRAFEKDGKIRINNNNQSNNQNSGGGDSLPPNW